MMPEVEGVVIVQVTTDAHPCVHGRNGLVKQSRNEASANGDGSRYDILQFICCTYNVIVVSYAPK